MADDIPARDDRRAITAVERETGLPKETLRVWERRYGFPQPGRDANGERLYPADQVARLLLLRRLVDLGHRPGKIVRLPLPDLAGMLDEGAPAPPPDAAGPVGQMLALLRTDQSQALRELLTATLLRDGLGDFAMRTGPALAAAVGAGWARGELGVHQEHLFTQQFSAVLRSAIDRAAAARSGPRGPHVLLTTLPQEAHGLGLLMAEAVLVLAGAQCVSLGVQTPVASIATAAEAYAADIVALSFSAWSPASLARDGLAELRGLLAPRVEIWAGGACGGLRPLTGVRIFSGLDEVADAVASWRAAADAPPALSAAPPSD